MNQHHPFPLSGGSIVDFVSQLEMSYAVRLEIQEIVDPCNTAAIVDEAW